jgi:hypothetical protein
MRSPGLPTSFASHACRSRPCWSGVTATFPLAIWVYVGNLGLNGVTALAMVMSMPHAHQADTERRGGVIVLILSCVLAALIALFAPRLALWALLLNALPVFSLPRRRTERRA